MPMRRVYLYFMLNNGWHCQFLEPDLKTSLPRTLTFSAPDKIREMHKRFGVDRKLEDKSALQYAINIWAVWPLPQPDRRAARRAPARGQMIFLVDFNLLTP